MRELLKYIYSEELYNLEQPNEAGPKLAVLVSKSDKSRKDLLSKILASINYTEQDIAIVESDEKLNLSGISSKTILSFGVKLHEASPKAFSISNHAGKTIIMAESLQTIDEDSTNEGKKKLWNLLKENFA